MPGMPERQKFQEGQLHPRTATSCVSRYVDDPSSPPTLLQLTRDRSRAHPLHCRHSQCTARTTVRVQRAISTDIPTTASNSRHAVGPRSVPNAHPFHLHSWGSTTAKFSHPHSDVKGQPQRTSSPRRGHLYKQSSRHHYAPPTHLIGRQQ